MTEAMVDIQQLATQLTLSIDQYDRILTLLRQIDHKLGTALPTELENLYSSLAELQKQATEIDHSFLGQLPREAAIPEALGALLDERASIVKKIIAENKEITTKAIGIQSLLAHELGSLRAGFSALNGYKHQENTQGRIVRSIS